MTEPEELLPCGHLIERSVFENTDGNYRLITLPPMWDGERLLMPGKVWCTEGCGWVETDIDVEHERLKAVTV